MEYARLGLIGLKVSRLCLGCMTYGVPDTGLIPARSMKKEPTINPNGYRTWDQFFRYGQLLPDGTSEEIAGRTLREFVTRDEVAIATKVLRSPAGRV